MRNPYDAAMVITLRALVFSPRRPRASWRDVLVYRLERAQHMRMLMRAHDAWERPVAATLELKAVAAEDGTLAFSWTHEKGFSFPAVDGRVVMRTFGPLALLELRARYAAPNDLATRLFEDVVGARLVRCALEQLFRAMTGAVREASAPPRGLGGRYPRGALRG